MVRWMDQKRMEPLRSATATAVARVQETAGPVAYRLVDRFFQAVDHQLMADFRYREAERVEALGFENVRAQTARRTADRYNAVCLDLLTDEFPTAIQEVRRQFGSQRIDLRESLAILEQEGHEQLADMDLKSEHVALAKRTLSETVQAANEAGINGLCDRLQDQATQFAELRSRRPEHNDPVTVVVGAVLCGIAAVTLAICWAASGPAGCSNPVVLTIVTVLLAAGAFILLTELAVFIAA